MAQTKFEINKPFPGPIPQHEGPFLEIWPPDGLVCIIQMPGISRNERQAFKKSFKQYAYIESTTPVPIALWVFDFPEPFGSVDCQFDARKCTGVVRSALANWMSPDDREIKNALYFFVLDGPILKAQKLFGIDPNAVRLFHKTIKKQLNMNYNADDYSRYLQGMFRYTSDELMRMGTVFKHKKK